MREQRHGVKNFPMTIPTETNTHLRWNDLLPVAPKGIGVPYLTYGAGRVGASITHWGGLHQVVYYGDGPMRSPPAYFQADASTAYVRLFRLQLVIGGLAYNPEFNETVHYPFGFSSRFRIATLGVDVSHSLTLLNDALVQSATVIENASALPLQLRLEHHEHTKHQSHGDLERTWSDWTGSGDGVWACTASDRLSEQAWQSAKEQTLVSHDSVGLACRETGPREGSTHLALLADGSMARTSLRGRTYWTTHSFTNGTKAVALVFASSSEALGDRVRNLRPQLQSIALDRQRACHAEIAELPAIDIGNPIVSSLFGNLPATVAACFVEDKPGAMRAAAMHYWVWGWDTLMCVESMLIAGNEDTVRNVLRFYRETADPEFGIGHQFTRELTVRIPQAPAAQCLYLVALHAYMAYTGDIAMVNEAYSFARIVFERALAARNDMGLGTGPALWPDFPICAGHTGRDCSAFNNSILYQGVRCMETLAGLVGDKATLATASDAARQLEVAFPDAFWDEAKGYFVDSIDSFTHEQRPSYPSHAMLWQSPFCGDLAPDKGEACARFISTHHATPRGFLPYPRWDSAFNGDHNQLGQTWPITDVFDTRRLAEAGDQVALATWMDGLAWFWQQLTIPEAYTMVTTNDSGTPDAPGGKQPFSAKSWYMAIISSIAGIDVDQGGITLGPGLAEPVVIERFRYRGSNVRLSVQGAGIFPEALTVKGKTVSGSCKIPMRILNAAEACDIDVEFKRTATPPTTPVILSMTGASLISANVYDDALNAVVEARASVWLKFAAPGVPTVTLDGAAVDITHWRSGVGWALLPTTGNASASLVISYRY